MRNSLILTLTIALSVFFIAPVASAADAGSIGAEAIQPEASQTLLTPDFFERTLSAQSDMSTSAEATEGIQPSFGCSGVLCWNQEDCAQACYPIIAVKCAKEYGSSQPGFCRYL
ncbi:MAG: hypothetical protein SX243_12050 [Acidobacteriota bacterium]|nr:hypothetical protein [Acidobacteriota bacterium]